MLTPKVTAITHTGPSPYAPMAREWVPLRASPAVLRAGPSTAAADRRPRARRPRTSRGTGLDLEDLEKERRMTSGTEPISDDEIRLAVDRLSRPHPSGGRVIERAGVLGRGHALGRDPRMARRARVDARGGRTGRRRARWRLRASRARGATAAVHDRPSPAATFRRRPEPGGRRAQARTASRSAGTPWRSARRHSRSAARRRRAPPTTTLLKRPSSSSCPGRGPAGPRCTAARGRRARASGSRRGPAPRGRRSPRRGR